MRSGRIVLGGVLLSLGVIWALQGYGSLHGSFMTGSSTWLWIGIGCIVAGAALVVVGIRARGGRS